MAAYKSLRFLKILYLAMLLFLAACEPPPISELSPEDGIQRIRSHHSDVSWDKVIDEVNEYRSRYPYTQYAAEAELLQADAYFQANRYPEAVVAYEDFLRKQPNHGNADLASFRIGRSYDLQSPESIDREQANALKAIEKYGVFLERHPKSALVPQAQERLADLRRKLADHYLFVARFYWKKDLYEGALTRYLALIKQFPMYADIVAEAKDKAAACYIALAKQLEKDPKSDLTVYFLGESPESLRKKADEILK